MSSVSRKSTEIVTSSGIILMYHHYDEARQFYKKALNFEKPDVIETLDMNRYREQKDKLEYEAMMRNPETAYLVSNEEFDKQLEELGWSPGDMVTMAGMYIERGMYNMKKGIRDFFREILELMFQAAALVIDTIRTFFLVVLAILGDRKSVV